MNTKLKTLILAILVTLTIPPIKTFSEKRLEKRLPEIPLNNTDFRFHGDLKLISSTQCSANMFKLLFEPYPNKYQILTHNLITTDLYKLQIFQVNLSNPSEIQKSNSKTTIILQHGLIGSSDEFFINGDDKSLGFYLVNQGYDVWVANSRGNKYSHSAIKLQMNLENYFDFSFQEMAIEDTAAIYHQILRKNGQDAKIVFIGFSQGTQLFFAALTDPMIYNFISRHTEKFIAQAPIAHLTGKGKKWDSHKQFSKIWPIIANLAKYFGYFEYLPATNCHSLQLPYLQQIIVNFCESFSKTCNMVLWLIGKNPRYNTIGDNLAKYFMHNPSGSSTKNMIHLMQLMDYNSSGGDLKGQPVFRKFDYGVDKNLEKYDYNIRPPQYKLEKIKTKVALVSGENDDKTTKEDIELIEKLLDKKQTNAYWLKNWDHDSFLYARDPQQLFDVIDLELKI